MSLMTLVLVLKHLHDQHYLALTDYPSKELRIKANLLTKIILTGLIIMKTVKKMTKRHV